MIFENPAQPSEVIDHLGSIVFLAENIASQPDPQLAIRLYKQIEEHVCGLGTILLNVEPKRDRPTSQ